MFLYHAARARSPYCWYMLVAVAAVVFVLGPASKFARAQTDLQVNDLAYGPLPEQRLDICKPVRSARLVPAVVLIHGGGWHGGDKKSLLGYCRSLANQGILGATINYRLVKAGSAANKWPAQLVDTQLAVRWLRANASDLNLDKARLCAYGASAGAHLAVYMATQKETMPGDQSSLYSKESSAISCAVDDFGPVDLVNADVLSKAAEILIGKPLTPDTEKEFIAASPLFQITNKTAPIFVLQGTHDVLVNASQSRRLIAALQRNGVPVNFLFYEGSHAWKGLTAPQRAEYWKQEVRFLTNQLIIR